jgi:hypothetical protein
MSRKLPLLIVIVFTSTLFALSANACERGERGCAGQRTCLPQNPWGNAVVPSIYDGGWGYPQSAEVCTYNAECYPWRSANGKYLLFGSINLNGPPRPGHLGGWDIYISEWDSLNNCWSQGVNAGPNINTPLAERRPSCTAQCDTLYFERNNSIFMSTRVGSLWTPACSLLAPVNIPAENRHPAISFDGQRLYFTSDRGGGKGGRDIWVAFRHNGVWDSVANLGEPINSPNEETRPFESSDRQRLYFSNNHGAPRPGGSFGGASDIYVSTWTGSGWGPIQLVAAPVNNDLCACSPYETPDGSELWIGSESWEGGRGDEDIWVARRDSLFPPQTTQGYGGWVKTGELANAIYVYDLEQDALGTIYAATGCAQAEPTGRVFKSPDEGQTWIPCGPLPGAMLVYDLLVEGDTLYAGTYPNGDVFKSIDRGDTWSNTAELPLATAVRCLVRLQNGDILAGTSPYDAQLRNRIFRTTDGGASWTEAAALESFNPPKFLYQTSDGAIFAGGWGIDCDTEIYRSLDDGVTWDSLVVIPHWECEWSTDGFLEASDGALYVTGWIPAQEPGVGGGFVCKSLDGGDTWSTTTKIMRRDGVHSNRIYAVAEDLPGRIYVGMQPAPDSVVFVSPDGGQTWDPTGGLAGAFECLCLLRAADGSIYAGTTPNGDVFRYLPQTKVDESRPTAPMAYRLAQNYPNPFNAATTIRFRLPQASRVTIAVYDILGRRIRALVDDDLKAGQHGVLFDGRDKDGKKLSSGVYLYRMQAGEIVQTRKMVYIK